MALQPALAMIKKEHSQPKELWSGAPSLLGLQPWPKSAGFLIKKKTGYHAVGNDWSSMVICCSNSKLQFLKMGLDPSGSRKWKCSPTVKKHTCFLSANDFCWLPPFGLATTRFREAIHKLLVVQHVVRLRVERGEGRIGASPLADHEHHHLSFCQWWWLSLIWHDKTTKHPNRC